MPTQTQAPTLPPAVPPVAEQPPLMEKPVGETLPPRSAAGEQPSVNSHNLATTEKRFEASIEEGDQSDKVAIAWVDITDKFTELKPDDVKKLASKGAEQGNRQFIPAVELSPEQALLEYQKFCKFGGELSMESYLKAFPEEFRPSIEQEILSLLRKGHLSSALLTAVVAGGIRYGTDVPKLENGVVPVAIYEPGTTGVNSYVEVYDTAFDPAEDPRYLLRHELAHALLMYRGRSLFFRSQDLAAIVNLAYSDPGAASSTAKEKEWPPPLGQAEARLLLRALSVGGNANLVQPFETPYVAGLLAQLQNNPADHALRTYILNEMLAERMTSYLSSNGSLADFLLKRINYSQAMREVPDQPVPDTDPLASASQEIKIIIMQASIEQAYSGYETLVPRLQDYAVRNPALADFIQETVFLHRRFSNGLATNRQLARGHSGSDQASGTLPSDNRVAWADVLETNQRPTRSIDTPGAAAKLPKRKIPWWQTFARALGGIMKKLGF